VSERLDFEGLDPTEFEEFCYELFNELDGFKNADWRKGTPKNASPADRGRDIVAETEREEVDGATHTETWFVDCKHYDAGVPPEAIQGLLTWAQAERPDVALIVASGYLSNGCKDFIARYVEENRPPFRIKYWEKPVLGRLTRGKSEFLERFLRSDIRGESEILAAENEFFYRIWYGRKLLYVAQEEAGNGKLDPDQYKAMLKAMKEVEEEFPELRPNEDDFEWGFWSGKLSALRWVLGDEWDNLDS
jgi:hypothetical protein